jgi:ribulose-phosphate 3-epimerase
VNRISASILAADFGRLAEEVRAVEKAGTDWIHVDVMDGHFVPNLTIGPPVVEALRKVTDLPLDVHLMIEHPERYIADFARAGAAYLTVHQEACPHLHGVIQEIRNHKVRPSVVINPGTPFAAVEAILPDVEMLLLMSVNPGFGGQKFIQSVCDKIATAKRFREPHGLDVLIEVDGGVKTNNVASVAAAGADVFVVGTGIFEAKDYAQRIGELRAEIEQGAAKRA